MERPSGFPIDDDIISSCSSIESDEKAQSIRLAQQPFVNSIRYENLIFSDSMDRNRDNLNKMRS